ncbi:MAG: DUF2029 domain-containing protein [Proteobacteria bacterium]|nr:DUF2029 domain-containing protein [Pseudomonadota bacterium]
MKRSLLSKIIDKKWLLIFLIISTAGFIWIMGTTSYMVNVENTRYVASGADAFGISHSCLTGYLAATHLAIKGADNIYEARHYSEAAAWGKKPTPIHHSAGDRFRIDEYHYPPPFLILPYGMIQVFGDFFTIRTVWFFLSITLVVSALGWVLFWCGGFRFQKQLLILPALFLAPSVHMALQISNIHILIIALGIISMIAFEKQWNVMGGAILGFAVVAKIWPAVLIAYLVFQRRWKPVLWCSIAMVAYSALAWFIFGSKPYVDFFFYELPRISSGEAFGFIGWYSQVITINMSVFGIPHKLYALGLLSSLPKLISPYLAWGYTLLILMTVAFFSFRRENLQVSDDQKNLMKVQLWFVLLTLAQLRSPFLPWHYGIVTTLWLLLLLGAQIKGLKGIVILFCWLGLSVNTPIGIINDIRELNTVYTLVASIIQTLIIFFALYSYWNRSDWSFHNSQPPAS